MPIDAYKDTKDWNPTTYLTTWEGVSYVVN
jgi:hypothetical protein